jgi:hypothetical protein
MSDNTNGPDEEDTSSPPPSTPDPSGAGPNPGDDPTEALKQGLAETRLPAHLKEQILAELPSAEEMERMFRDLQEQGGLSFEEFCASLGLEVNPKP